MCKIKNDLLNNIFSLIEKKKDFYDENLIVNEFDDNIIIQNFSSWEEFISDTKTKNVKKIGDFSENKNVLIIYAKKGTIVPITDFECSKTYIFLNGKLNLLFDNKEDVMIEGLSTIEVNEPHGGEVFQDTYFLVIDEY